MPKKWEIRDSGSIGHMKRRGKGKKVVKDKNEEKEKRLKINYKGDLKTMSQKGGHASYLFIFVVTMCTYIPFPKK